MDVEQSRGGGLQVPPTRNCELLLKEGSMLAANVFIIRNGQGYGDRPNVRCVILCLTPWRDVTHDDYDLVCAVRCTHLLGTRSAWRNMMITYAMASDAYGPINWPKASHKHKTSGRND
jgi:hypothetical protein